ncbi:hypothetical protein G4H71_14015 [Rhodococcus triatomae]|uniref:Uncharacterized protein n=1 Tax=Rhodococcus triatomae TaxID=300028 RepID=A0A1G8PGD3_9NOCA|nr:hypothetical protein [Rhodococcus triatomae]QNG20090.1 hypothetical protein G4H72_16360 [Rhodococcus triatomae]QNG23994.1 hypothetical protein G4H71_14015 [Rhodococcus triatomae]SDI91325.1 hypothetical protein SAMN05444695_11316 [Rhodococcus triatomae]
MNAYVQAGTPGSSDRWFAEGRYFTIVSFGRGCDGQARRMLGQLRGRRVNWIRSGSGSRDHAALVQAVEEATVGWRLMLIGAADDVTAARERALAAGVLATEIRTDVVDVPRPFLRQEEYA